MASLVATGLTICLYALLTAAFMRRSTAKATHPSVIAAAAAGVASWLPFAMPLLPHGEAGPLGLFAANTLLVFGLGFAVWSIRYLDRSFSMIAQARAVVRSGPYAVVRHPLYTGELVALLGTVLVHPGVWSVGVWAAILCLQAYRVRHEEAILAATLEDYRDYQRSTPQLIPLSVSRLLRHR
jgi:protein-S-isoprenylcysteine O-methyltransferase Ste14